MAAPGRHSIVPPIPRAPGSPARRRAWWRRGQRAISDERRLRPSLSQRPSWRLTATAALAALTGCGGVAGDGSTSDAVAGPGWARAADAWIAAYDAAARSPEDGGHVEVASFYAADVVFDSAHDEYDGRLDVTELDRSFAVSLESHEFGEVYLDASGFVRTEALTWAASRRPTVRQWDVGPDGIVSMQGYRWLPLVLAADPGPSPAGHAATLASAYVSAWSGADHAALRALYWSGAVLEDSLYGRQTRGREAIVALADPRTAAPSVLQRAENLYREEVLEHLPAPHGAPAVYVSQRLAQPDARHPAQVLALTTSEARCPGASAVVLTLDDVGLVIAERRFHSVRSVRECSRRGDLADGWWDDRELPIPLGERVTSRVAVGSSSIEIRNGTPELEEFVRWGLSRFDEAGLAPPRVASVAFDPYSPRCHDFDGYAEPASGTSHLLVCADAATIAREGTEDPTCSGARCPAIHPSTRDLLLHEMAHAWLDREAGPPTRERFLAHVGARSWDDPATPHDERGVEVAASVLAWGLSANARVRRDLAAMPCRTRVEAFHLLTGTAPLTGCR